MKRLLASVLAFSVLLLPACLTCEDIDRTENGQYLEVKPVLEKDGELVPVIGDLIPPSSVNGMDSAVIRYEYGFDRVDSVAQNFSFYTIGEAGENYIYEEDNQQAPFVYTSTHLVSLDTFGVHRFDCTNYLYYVGDRCGHYETHLLELLIRNENGDTLYFESTTTSDPIEGEVIYKVR